MTISIERIACSGCGAAFGVVLRPTSAARSTAPAPAENPSIELNEIFCWQCIQFINQRVLEDTGCYDPIYQAYHVDSETWWWKFFARMGRVFWLE